MTTIIANIPATTRKHNGKTFTTQAYIAEFTASTDGKWTGPYGAMLEADVIDICRKATNWSDIRAKHFPMFGFHN